MLTIYIHSQNSLLTKKFNKHHKGINSWTHFVSMLFCHLSSADS
ncbi:DUF4372 domain-containing protein, partial [Sphingobacterium bovisgrunnientis]